MVRTIGREQDPAQRIRNRQGRAIADVREMQGMTRVRLAAEVDVTEGAVRSWEDGRTTPRAHLQVRIAEVLNVPHSTLFGLDGEVA